MNYFKHIITTLVLGLFIMLGMNSVYAENIPRITIKDLIFPTNITIGETILVTGYLETNANYKEDLEAEINYMILPNSDAQKLKGRPFSKAIAHLTKDIIIHKLYRGNRFYFEQEIAITPGNFKLLKDLNEAIKPNNVVMIWPTNVRIKGGDEIIPEQFPINLTKGATFVKPKRAKTPSVDIISLDFPTNINYGEVTKVTGVVKSIGLQKEKIDNISLKYNILTDNGAKTFEGKSKLLKAKGEHLFYFEQEIVINEENFKITKEEIRQNNVVMIWPTNVKVIGQPEDTPSFEGPVAINTVVGSEDDGIVGSAAPPIKSREKNNKELKKTQNNGAKIDN